MAGPTKFLQGQLLLDGGKLHGSFFHRAVVLICQHDAEGAFGLILNRPAGGRKVGDARGGQFAAGRQRAAALHRRPGAAGPVELSAFAISSCPTPTSWPN